MNLIYERLWTKAGSNLLISILENFTLVLFNCYYTGAIDVNIDMSVLEEKSFFKMLGVDFFF